MTDENKPSAVDDAADIMSKYEKSNIHIFPGYEKIVKIRFPIFQDIRK